MEDKLSRLHELISAWPGLVSDPDPALVRDGLALLPHLGGARRLIDVGSGGGLPGLPIAIARPDLDVVLLEANQRKAAFLTQAAWQLDLPRVVVVAERAEDAGRDPRWREGFDVATARALAAMATLAELCLPFVRPGGRLLAMKADSPGLEAEIAAGKAAVGMLGGAYAGSAQAVTDARSHGVIVIVAKLTATPDEYPRRSGLPAHRPLGVEREK